MVYGDGDRWNLNCNCYTAFEYLKRGHWGPESGSLPENVGIAAGR